MNKKFINYDKYSKYGFLFIAPFMLAIFIFSVYPNCYALYLSFTNYNGFDPLSFIGFNNFKRLFSIDTNFWISLINTWKLWLLGFIPQLCFGLYLSYIFTYGRIKRLSTFRLIFIFPNLITAAAIGQLAAAFLGYPDGVINQILINLSIIDKPIDFIRSEFSMQFTVIFINFTMWFGYTTIIFCAGLTSISPSYFDAARVEGAKNIQIFFKITLPLLRPTLLYVLITSLIGGLQMFDIPFILGSGIGSPNKSLLTMIGYLQQQAFANGNYGYAASIAVILFIMIILVSVFIMLVNKKYER